MKLLFFCGAGKENVGGNTEIGGFGITAADNPFLVEDFVTVNQENYSFFVKFDDEAVANFFEDQVEAGKHPSQFGRIWLHTHPGASPFPSGVDEDTFKKAFGNCDQAVMFIMAENGPVYARLRKGEDEFFLNVDIQFDAEYRKLDPEAWKKEFAENIHAVAWREAGNTLGTEQRWSNYYEEYDPEELGLEQWLPKRESMSMPFGQEEEFNQEEDISLEPWMLEREEYGLSSFEPYDVYCSFQVYKKLLELTKASREAGGTFAFDNAVYAMLEDMENFVGSLLKFKYLGHYCEFYTTCGMEIGCLQLKASIREDGVRIDFLHP